jgi:NAD(P)-dependent dehydrogenase (short-subunit alcohol dehydrogenase family)
MSDQSLTGARVLVAGASSGIGRAFAIGAVKEGAHVVMAARRGEHLEKTRADAGGGLCVPIDLTEPDAGPRVAAATRQHLGGLDVLLWCVGAAPLRMLADTGEQEWRQVFGTNVIAAHRLLQACLPLMNANSMVLVLSSEAVGQPRTGLGAYATSKAALERLISGWRAEQSGVRFTTVTVGATFPTDFGNAFDGDLLTRLLDDWAARGLAQQDFMSPEAVAAVLLGTAATALRQTSVCVEHLTVRSPSPVTGTFDQALAPFEGAFPPAPGAIDG